MSSNMRIESARRKWAALSERPFVHLVRLFLGRIFYGNGDAGEGELPFGAGVLLALLPLPGGFYAVFLFEKYSSLLEWMRGEQIREPLTAAMPEEYFFIVLSVVVTGLVSVWRWDSIFPDRRDHANLVPLPLRTGAIFLSNLIAVLLLAAILAIDVNLASAFLFPLALGASVNSFGFFVHFLGVHALVVIMASVYSFFAVLLTIGLLMAMLPYPLFRRFSLYLRAAIIAGLVATPATSFAVPTALDRWPNTVVHLLPPVWFLGLSQRLGHVASPQLAALARTALIASAITLVASVIIYAISYGRFFARIPEVANDAGRTRPEGFSWIYKLLDRTVLTSPFDRGGYRFVVKTLLRSEPHTLTLGGFCALGFVLAAQFLVSAFNGRHSGAGTVLSPELLALPLILSYCTLVGIRLAFEVPIELRANWIFQFNIDKTNGDAASLATKMMLSFVLPWVFAIVLPLSVCLYGLGAGLLESFVVTTWSFLLARALVLRFRKLAFTCAFPPFRESAVVLAISYVLGFFVFVVLTANLEYWALFSPARAAVLITIAGICWYVLFRLRKEVQDADKRLIFDEGSPTGYELLDLARGS